MEVSHLSSATETLRWWKGQDIRDWRARSTIKWASPRNWVSLCFFVAQFVRTLIFFFFCMNINRTKCVRKFHWYWMEVQLTRFLSPPKFCCPWLGLDWESVLLCLFMSASSPSWNAETTRCPTLAAIFQICLTTRPQAPLWTGSPLRAALLHQTTTRLFSIPLFSTH